ncbi:MAG TPA: helix-turn-helix transcriptional regulator [Candidatus Saccharimonadales bacterium]|nr:helix-turn-helix transcriptional regulator [Candidatus Saccharimonadales bacterium]
MSTITFEVLPPPTTLSRDVVCVRIAKHTGQDEPLEVKICPNGLPGLVFGACEDGQAAIKSIAVQSMVAPDIPILFLHGQGYAPSIMRFNEGPYTTIQVVLKPHALYSIFGMEAAAMNQGFMLPAEFGAPGLEQQVLALGTDAERVNVLCAVLTNKVAAAGQRDELIEKSLVFIDTHVAAATIKDVIEHLHISERQFQKRFARVVGMQPQMYIRVRRVNEALRLINTGQYERFSDIAHALNFYDQSHFIREMKAFSWVTPKDITQKVKEFHQDPVGASYL